MDCNILVVVVMSAVLSVGGLTVFGQHGGSAGQLDCRRFTARRGDLISAHWEGIGAKIERKVD